MATIGNLVVNVTARTSGLVKGLKKSTARLDKFGSKITAITTKVAGFGAALTAVAAGGGMALLIKRSFGTIDAIAKLSDRTGIATEKLIGLRRAAELTGVSAEVLDSSLEKMVKRLGTINLKGGGAAKAALDNLGLSAERLARLTPDKQFGLIADALRQLPTPAEKAATAFDIFGKSGQQLVNLLDTGSEGIARMQAETEELGLTFSRIDAAKVEMANDAFNRLRSAIVGIAQRITIKLAPLLNVLSTSLTSMLTDNRPRLDALIDAGINGFTSLVETALNAFDGLTRGFARIHRFVLERSADMVGAAASVFEVLSKLPGATGRQFGIQAFGANLASDLLDRMAKGVGEQIQKSLDAASSGDKFRAWLEDLEDRASKVGKAWGAGLDDAQGGVAALDATVRGASGLQTLFGLARSGAGKPAGFLEGTLSSSAAAVAACAQPRPRARQPRRPGVLARAEAARAGRAERDC